MLTQKSELNNGERLRDLVPAFSYPDSESSTWTVRVLIPILNKKSIGVPRTLQKVFARSASLVLAALCCANLATSAFAEDSADVVHSYSNMGGNPNDMSLRVDRPRPKPVVRRSSSHVAVAATGTAFPASMLRGSKTILSYDESDNQVLPTRVATVTNYDAVQQKWVSQNVRLSRIIETEARQQGIDPLIVEIIIRHESGFNPTAQSGVGACGYMQLMPETAASLGVTDINDPAQNIAAGTRYFAEQYRRYGNLHLALAAYNAGPGSVDTYGGVPPYDETVNYCSSIAQEYANRCKKRVS